jgi:hypothetical protein
VPPFSPENREFHTESKMEGVERHGITKIEIKCITKGAAFDKEQVCQVFRLGAKNRQALGSKVRARARDWMALDRKASTLGRRR